MHCSNTTEEVGRGAVGVAKSLTDEDRPLKVEEIDTREDICEAGVHDKEEECALVVLDDFGLVGAGLVVEDDADKSEEDRLEDLEDHIERLTELVNPGTFEDSTELVAPPCIVACLNFVELGPDFRHLLSQSFLVLLVMPN